MVLIVDIKVRVCIVWRLPSAAKLQNIFERDVNIHDGIILRSMKRQQLNEHKINETCSKNSLP